MGVQLMKRLVAAVIGIVACLSLSACQAGGGQASTILIEGQKCQVTNLGEETKNGVSTVAVTIDPGKVSADWQGDKTKAALLLAGGEEYAAAAFGAVLTSDGQATAVVVWFDVPNGIQLDNAKFAYDDKSVMLPAASGRDGLVLTRQDASARFWKAGGLVAG